MIDKIHLSLPGRHKPPNVNYKRYVSNWLGYVGRVRLKQYPDWLSIIISLPKLLKGENISVLSLGQVEGAVHKLEDELRLDLTSSSLISVEVGVSVIVKEPPGRYLNLFGCHSERERHEWGRPGRLKTVSYQTPKGSYEFIAYDKNAEVVSKKEKERMTIPPVFRGSNVLRLEYKIVKRQGIKEKFKGDLSVHDLYDPVVYGRLKNLFHADYRKIQKTGGDVFWDCEFTLTPKGFRDLLAEQYLQEHPDQCNQFVASARAKGLLSEVGYKRIKEMCKAKDTDTGVRSTPYELIDELNERVADWVKTG